MINGNTARIVRNASLNNNTTTLHRRSNAVSNEKPKASCNCIELIKEELTDWENKFTEKFNILYDSFQQHTTNINATIIKEVTGLKNYLEPLVHNLQQLHIGRTSVTVKHQQHLNSHTKLNKNENNINNNFSNNNLTINSSSSLN